MCPDKLHIKACPFILHASSACLAPPLNSALLVDDAVGQDRPEIFAHM
jgi:hypothetical protein